MSAYDYAWQISLEAYEGTHSIANEDINDYDFAAFDIILADVPNVPTTGTVYFFVKCDVETYWDYLSVFLDDVYQFQSDVATWTEYEVAIDSSVKITISYAKDSYGSNGLDTCWVDNIRTLGCPVDDGSDDTGGNDTCIDMIVCDFESTIDTYGFIDMALYDYGWTITTTEVYDGTYSFESDDIDDYDIARFDINLDYMAGIPTTGTVYF